MMKYMVSKGYRADTCFLPSVACFPHGGNGPPILTGLSFLGRKDLSLCRAINAAAKRVQYLCVGMIKWQLAVSSLPCYIDALNRIPDQNAVRRKQPPVGSCIWVSAAVRRNCTVSK